MAKKVINIKVDHVGWNVDEVLKVSEDDFAANPQHLAFYRELDNPDDRTAALRNAYRIIKQKYGTPAATAATAATTTDATKAKS